MIFDLMKRSDETYKNALEAFIAGYTSPAFGVLPKSEVDQLVLQLFIDVGLFRDKKPSVYEISQKLKITTSRARTLVYARELKSADEHSLMSDLESELQKPRLAKDGDFFVLAIDSPVLREHLKNKVRLLGLVYDSSFSPENVRLSPRGYAKLIETVLNDSQKARVREVLGGGLEPEPVSTLLEVGLKTLGNRVAGEFGEVVSDRVSNFVKAVFSNNKKELRQIFNSYKLEIIAR